MFIADNLFKTPSTVEFKDKDAWISNPFALMLPRFMYTTVFDTISSKLPYK